MELINTILIKLPTEIIINILEFFTISQLYQLNYLLKKQNNNKIEQLVNIISNNSFNKLFKYKYKLSKSLYINYAVLLNEDDENVLNWIDTIEHKPIGYTNNNFDKMQIGAYHGFINVYYKYETEIKYHHWQQYTEGLKFFKNSLIGNNYDIIADVYDKISEYETEDSDNPFNYIIIEGIKYLVNNNKCQLLEYLLHVLFGDGYDKYMSEAMEYSLSINNTIVVGYLIKHLYDVNESALSFDISEVLSNINETLDPVDALNEFFVQLSNKNIEIEPECLSACLINALLYGRDNTMKLLISSGAIINTNSISSSILGKNIDCVKYILDNVTVDKERFLKVITFSSSHGNKEIVEYLINKYPLFINNNTFDNLLNHALSNANKQCILYAKELGARSFSASLIHANKLILLRTRYCNNHINHFSELQMKLFSFSDDFNDEFFECMQLVTSWIQ